MFYDGDRNVHEDAIKFVGKLIVWFASPNFYSITFLVDVSDEFHKKFALAEFHKINATAL